MSLAITPVYPRWRGEHRSMSAIRVRNDGLSPLAWGTPHMTGQTTDGGRFIAAGVGNTVTTAAALTAAPVYPRWRGEHIQHLGNIMVNIGLSPLAWGTRQQSLLRQRR